MGNTQHQQMRYAIYQPHVLIHAWPRIKLYDMNAWPRIKLHDYFFICVLFMLYTMICDYKGFNVILISVLILQFIHCVFLPTHWVIG